MVTDAHVPPILTPIIRAPIDGFPRQTFVPSDISILASPNGLLNDNCINGCAALLYSAFPLLPVVLSFPPTISLGFVIKLTMTRSGTMHYGHNSGTNLSGFFRYIVQCPTGTGFSAQSAFLPGNFFFLTALLNNGHGKMILRLVPFLHSLSTNTYPGHHPAYLSPLQGCPSKTGL